MRNNHFILSLFFCQLVGSWRASFLYYFLGGNISMKYAHKFVKDKGRDARKREIERERERED
jgi:hypothetical protein